MNHEHNDFEIKDNHSRATAHLNVEGLEDRNLLAADFDDSLVESRDLGTVTEQPTSVAAEISEPTDVDMVRLNLVQGQTINMDVDTLANGPGGLGAYMKVFNDQGVELAANNDGTAPDDSSAGFDPYLRFTAPQNGQYFVAISNWQNIGYDPISGDGDRVGDQHLTGAYQLHLRSLPMTDVDDTISEAISLGGAGPTSYSVNGQIDPDVDVDMFSINVLNGQTINFDIDTPQNGPGGLGSYLRLFDVNGQELAANNDAAAPGETLGFDAYLSYTFTNGGLYYLGISNYGNTSYSPITGNGDTGGSQHPIGAYQLTISEATPTWYSESMGSGMSAGNMAVDNEAEATPGVADATFNVANATSMSDAASPSAEGEDMAAPPVYSPVAGGQGSDLISPAVNINNGLAVNGNVELGVSLRNTMADFEYRRSIDPLNDPNSSEDSSLSLIINSLVHQVPPVYASVNSNVSSDFESAVGTSQLSVFPGIADATPQRPAVTNANDVALSQL